MLPLAIELLPKIREANKAVDITIPHSSRVIDRRTRRLIRAAITALGTLVVLATWLGRAVSSPQTGWDFPVFYLAAKLPPQMLYSHAAFAAASKHYLAPIGVSQWAPYVRPAAFAPLLYPLGSLPYHEALWVWMAAATCAYLISVGLLVNHLRLPAFLLPACAAYFPALAGIISGQDTAIYVLAVAVAIVLLRRERNVLAGAVLVVCLCKFNLVMLVPLALITHKRFSALISFCVGAICIAAISLYMTPFPTYISAIIRAQSDTAGFYPVGLKGFSAAIGQPWCFSVMAVIVVVLCCWLMLKLPLLAAVSVAITGALLISPYITWYDSTVLVIPLAVLFAGENPIARWTVLAVLVASPLWEHGGGNNGPIGFMHVGVELFILACFVQAAFRCNNSSRSWDLLLRSKMV